MFVFLPNLEAGISISTFFYVGIKLFITTKVELFKFITLNHSDTAVKSHCTHVQTLTCLYVSRPQTGIHFSSPPWAVTHKTNSINASNVFHLCKRFCRTQMNITHPKRFSPSVSYQRISDLEEQLAGVCEELKVARAHHKQQLAEVAKLREEEKQRAFLDKEAYQDQLRSDMDRARRDLERSHEQEKEAALEKVGDCERRNMVGFQKGYCLHKSHYITRK